MKGTEDLGLRQSLVLLAVSLGTLKGMRNDIDKEFAKNKSIYEDIMSEDHYRRLDVLDNFTLETSEYVKKCFVIVTTKYLDGNDSFNRRWIKRGYKDAYNFYNKNKVILLEMFNYEYISKKGIYDVSGNYIDYSGFVIFYMSCVDGKQFEHTPLKDLVLRNYFDLTSKVDIRNELKVISKRFDSYPKRLLETMNTQIDDMKKKHYLDKVKGTTDIRMITENIKLQDEKRYSVLTGFNQSPEMKNLENHKLINYFYLLLGLMEIDSSFMMETEIDKELLDGLLKFTTMHRYENGFTERETEIAFIAGLFLYSLSSEYNEVRKKKYVSLQNEITQKESIADEKIKAVKEEFQSKLDIANSEISSLKFSLSNQETVNSTLNSTNKDLVLEVRRLQQENEKLKNKESELESLIKLMFEAENGNSNEVSDDFNIDEAVSILNTSAITIIGGHVNLRRKLKELLPNVVILGTTDVSRDFSFVKNKDFVFYSSLNNKHIISDKVMPYIKSYGVELAYLPKSQNVNKVIEFMHKVVSNKNNKQGQTT